MDCKFENHNLCMQYICLCICHFPHLTFSGTESVMRTTSVNPIFKFDDPIPLRIQYGSIGSRPNIVTGTIKSFLAKRVPFVFSFLSLELPIAKTSTVLSFALSVCRNLHTMLQCYF